MDRETKQQTSPLHPNQTIHTAINDSNKKQPGSGSGSINDRIKRDEWSQGAVSSLLEAYETKWVHRNRAKLKGQDWEEVAKFVSSRANSTKSPKTQTQCKNKIESMKKRYRSESAAESSSWPLFPRLDHLLRVSGIPQRAPLLPQPQFLSLTPMMQEPSQPLAPPKEPLLLLTTPYIASVVNIGVAAENSNGSNGADRTGTAKEDGICRKLSSHESDKKAMETDSSTPGLCSDKEKTKSENLTRKAQRKKKQRRQELGIGDSVRWFAEVVLRTEQARLDAMKELERMRAESEAKRGEMELHRTQIIANTHLEIARIFAGKGKGVDTGRSG